MNNNPNSVPVQISKEEMEMCRRSPLYFYNKFARKPDQPELTQAQFDEMRYPPKIIRTPGGNKATIYAVGFELIDDTE